MPQRLAVDVRNVSLTFETLDGKVDALSNVSLQIADGEFVSFIGPSGCGKTTMLRLIADLQQSTAATLLVNGMSAEQARLERRYGCLAVKCIEISPAIFYAAGKPRSHAETPEVRHVERTQQKFSRKRIWPDD